MPGYDAFFFDRLDKEGREKERLLESPHAVIAPAFPHGPRHRLTWERIQEDIAESKTVAIQAMRDARQDAHLSEIYQGVDSISPTEIFFDAVVRHSLPDFLTGYRPEFGADVDILLLIDDLEKPVFRFEIFPRSEPGVMVCRWGSRIVFNRIPMTAMVGEDKLDVISTLLRAELIPPADRAEQDLMAWCANGGVWDITRPRNISLFLNKACFSYVEARYPESKPMVMGGTIVDDRSGEDLEAKLVFTRSK